MSLILVVTLAVAGIASLSVWIRRRRLRYKRHGIIGFDVARRAVNTGDIILFHKTNRSGVLDVLELDFLSPLIFGQTEFRHAGIMLREGEQLFVIECADRLHSGYDSATYLTGGNGIRKVPLETLLAAYNRDNGDPHFGFRHVGMAISPDKLREVIASYRAIDYLPMTVTVGLLCAYWLLPRSRFERRAAAHANHMMCTEFVHHVLNRCGALRDYPSKVFMPYYIEDAKRFSALEAVPFSPIVRFRYSGEVSDRRSEPAGPAFTHATVQLTTSR
jgi:hypothetical protein